MKITVGPAGAANKHYVKVEIWLTEAEATTWPAMDPTLATALTALDLCIREHKLTGHRSTRHLGLKG